MNTEEKKRVLILGAGFGGTYVYKNLHKTFHKHPKVELSLIDDSNYFLFTPMLHEVATGNLAPENIIEPLRKVLGCMHAGFHLGTVKSVSTKKKEVKTSNGVVPYDILVVALGATTNFRGVPGAKEHCYELKSLDDAIKLKNHFIETFERAASEEDSSKRAEMLHFVVVGGGPTGVELAAEMADLFFDTFGKYYDREMMNQVKISLVQKGSELLEHFPVSLREKSLKLLQKKNVDIHFGVVASEVGTDQVVLDNGETLKAHTAIWTAGVKPVELDWDVEMPLERGKIDVTETMQAKGYSDIYVLGDMANFVNPVDGKSVPALAQVATSQATGVADNIKLMLAGKKPKSFKYRHKGSFVSLGDWAAAGEIGRVPFFGHLAWWMWRTIYLTKLISWQKMMQVMLDWTINLFTPRDISMLYRCPECKRK